MNSAVRFLRENVHIVDKYICPNRPSSSVGKNDYVKLRVKPYVDKFVKILIFVLLEYIWVEIKWYN